MSATLGVAEGYRWFSRFPTVFPTPIFSPPSSLSCFGAVGMVTKGNPTGSCPPHIAPVCQSSPVVCSGRPHACAPNESAFSFLGFPQAKLVRYICKQRQCKLSVAPGERTSELNSYPRFSDWLYTFNVRPEVVQVCGPWGLGSGAAVCGSQAKGPHAKPRTALLWLQLRGEAVYSQEEGMLEGT